MFDGKAKFRVSLKSKPYWDNKDILNMNTFLMHHDYIESLSKRSSKKYIDQFKQCNGHTILSHVTN